MVDRDPTYRVQRRVAGCHNVRLDGMSDLLLRARDGSVLDLGCNRGMVSYEFADCGAAVVHGLDNYKVGIEGAREIFADRRDCQYRFEVADLTAGPVALDTLGDRVDYDFVLLLAVIHKLKREMSDDLLRALIRAVGERCRKYVVWRGTQRDEQGNDEEMRMLDSELGGLGFRRVQWTAISDLGPGVIWARG
jgi:SAM-dependent methyltransferase